MYYLKCSKCGHLNELKTEYITFCTNCNAKLENNFQSWHKINADRTLDEYKKEVCITAESLISAKHIDNRKKIRKYRMKFLTVFAFSFIALTIAGYFLGIYLVRYFQNEMTSENIFEKKWDIETYGNFGLTLETPYPMTETKVTVPANVKDVIESIETFAYDKKRGFKVTASSVQFKPVVRAVNIQGAANRSVAEIKRQDGVTDLNYTEDIVMISKIKGIKQKGSYKKNHIPFEFITVVLGDGLHLWQVTIIYNQTDMTGKKAAERVIKSLEIYNVSPA